MKKKVVWVTLWVFDLFHIWHLNILRRAKAKCDKLCVWICSDEQIFIKKWKYPIIPLNERIEIMKSIKYVDKVFVDYDWDNLRYFREHKWDILFKWDDWKWHERRIGYEKILKEEWKKVVFFPYTNTTSSTLIREILVNFKCDNW